MRYGLGVILAVTLLARATSAAHPGAGGHLLLDNRLIVETDDVGLPVGCVEKHPSPVETVDIGTKRQLLVDDYVLAESVRVTQMWYLATSRDVAYAESKDRIHWDKPNVGRGGNNHVVVDLCSSRPCRSVAQTRNYTVRRKCPDASWARTPCGRYLTPEPSSIF